MHKDERMYTKITGLRYNSLMCVLRPSFFNPWLSLTPSFCMLWIQIIYSFILVFAWNIFRCFFYFPCLFYARFIFLSFHVSRSHHCMNPRWINSGWVHHLSLWVVKSITQAFMLKLKKQWLDKISRPWVLFHDHLSVQTRLSFLCLALISLAFLFSIIDTSLGDLHRFHPTILKHCFRSVTNIEMPSYHSMLKYLAFRPNEKEHFVQTVLCV